LSNKINRLIIKNVDYISFKSTGFYLLKELLENRTITTPEKTYKLPENLIVILIIEKEWLFFFSELNEDKIKFKLIKDY